MQPRNAFTSSVLERWRRAWGLAAVSVTAADDPSSDPAFDAPEEVRRCDIRGLSAPQNNQTLRFGQRAALPPAGHVTRKNNVHASSCMHASSFFFQRANRAQAACSPVYRSRQQQSAAAAGQAGRLKSCFFVWFFPNEVSMYRARGEKKHNRHKNRDRTRTRNKQRPEPDPTANHLTVTVSLCLSQWFKPMV